MKLNDVLSRFTIKNQNNDRVVCICPAHDDKQASLSITQDKITGNILLNCFAGCDTQDILNEVGLKISDLFQDSNNNEVASTNNTKTKPKIKEIYTYTNMAGCVLYQVLRYEPKNFKYRQPKSIGLDNDGEPYYNEPLDNNNPNHWIWNLQGVTRTLYKLPELLDAINDGKTVYFVEGEKDAHTLNKLGLAATTAGGVNNWRLELGDYFINANVVVIPDNDKPGKDHAIDVAYDIQCMGADNIKLLELPGLPPKGDITDWIEQGHTLDDLRALVKECSAFMPDIRPGQKEKQERNIESKQILNDQLTDLGNAKRFVELHGENFRFDVNAKKFLNWNGKHWEYDELFRVNNLASESIKSYYRDLECAPDSTDRDKIYNHIKKSQNRYGLDSMIILAKEQKGIPVKANMLDTDTMLLNCRNGTLDLTTGKLQPHNKKQLITKIVDMDYDKLAKCPTWDKFINDIFCGDMELVYYVQKALGYSLTGDTSEQVFFMLYGKGSNGKSTLIDTISNILKDYHKGTSTETLLDQNNKTGANNDIAGLRGARIVTAVETTEGRKLNEPLVKELTGGDKITARFLYCEPFTYSPQFKIFLAVNHLPTISGQDFGIWRRIKPIPFNARFEGVKADKMLKDKLKMEYPGILNWLVAGCLNWQKEGLGTCDAVDKTKSKYQTDMDIMAEFLTDCCIVDYNAMIKSSTLYNVYQNWAIERGERRPLTQTTFSRRLEERGNFEKVRTGSGYVWHGIGVIDNNHSDGEIPQIQDNTNQSNIENTNVEDDLNLNMYSVHGMYANSENPLEKGSLVKFSEISANPTHPTLITNDDLASKKISDGDSADLDYKYPEPVEGRCNKCEGVMVANLVGNGNQKTWVAKCTCGNYLSLPNWRISTWRKDNNRN